MFSSAPLGGPYVEFFMQPTSTSLPCSFAFGVGAVNRV